MALDKLKGKRIIVIDMEEITFIPYILPVINALKSKSGNSSYYLATNYIYIGSEELDVFDINKRKQFYISLSSKLFMTDLFLSAHINAKGYKNAIRVNMFHSQPVKFETYPKRDFVNYDVYFLLGPLNREQIEMTVNKYKLENKNIRLFNVGYPKSDALLKGEYNKSQILIELGLKPDNPTVLYSPSWDEGLSLRSSGEAVIKKILEMKSVNLIVKLHPVSYTPKEHPSFSFYTGGIDWSSRLSQFDRSNNFIHLKTSDKIDPLLEASDIMITDVSSVALEFIALDKPVIYIDCPEYFEKTIEKVYSQFGNSNQDYAKNDPKANAGRHVGLIVKDINELPKAIHRSINNPGEFSDKRKKLAEKLCYNPGTASNVAANIIIDLIGDSGKTQMFVQPKNLNIAKPHS